jgi:hypothetical protein
MVGSVFQGGEQFLATWSINASECRNPIIIYAAVQTFLGDLTAEAGPSLHPRVPLALHPGLHCYEFKQ